MRLKKIMSLVLVCAMMLSLATVASAADTKVYFHEDFSGYTDIASYLASSNVLDAVSNKDSTHNIGATTLNAAAALRTANNASIVTFAGTANISFATSNFTFVNNDFGSKALKVYDERFEKMMLDNPNYIPNNLKGHGAMMVSPKESWDLVENADETYIVSYEMEVDTTKYPVAQGNNDYQRAVGTNWLDAAGNRVNKGVFKYSVAEATGVDAAEGETPDSVVTNKIYTAPAKWTFSAINNKWDSGTKDAALNSGDAHRVAFGYKYADQEEPMRIFAMDGAAFPGWSDSLKDKLNDSLVDHSVYTKLDSFYVAYSTRVMMSLANIRMYTIKNNSFKAYVENDKNVPLSQKTIRVKFANPVAPATWDNTVVVKKDGAEMSADEYGVGTLKTVVDGTEIYSYVDVTFTNLEEATTYTIDFADTIKNEIATAIGEANSVVTFSTKLPDVKFNNITVVGAANLVADGSLQAVKLDLENTTAENKAVSIIYAVYAANGKLESVSYVNDTIAASKTAEIETGLKLATEGKLKTYLWESMVAFKPYTAEKTLTIAAPAVAE